MGKEIYAVLLDLEHRGEYSIMTVTTDKEYAKEQASLTRYRKVAKIGEMIEEGE